MTDLISDLVDQTHPVEAPGNPYSVTSPPNVSPAQAEIVPPQAVEARPEPGFILSCIGTFLFPGSQLVIAFPVLIVVSALVASGDKAAHMTGMLAGSQGCVLALALVAGVFCSWIAKHHVFSLAPVRILHIVAIVSLVLPAAMVSRAFYDVAFIGWSHLTDLIPPLKAMDQVNTMSQIGDIVANVPFPVMLFAMAVVPALAEEIVFRGIIGRGLKARYGTISGILMTSILFGMAHVHPAHAMSVIPLGIVMHVLYVTTRSFWAPVLFHFFNNAFAVIGAVAVTKAGQTATVADAPALPWYVIVAGMGSVAAWFYLLSVTRTRLVTEEGTDWDPGYDSVETPRHIHTTRVLPELPLGGTLAAFMCGAIFFGALFAFSVVEGMTRMNAQDAMIGLWRLAAIG